VFLRVTAWYTDYRRVRCVIGTFGTCRSDSQDQHGTLAEGMPETADADTHTVHSPGTRPYWPVHDQQ